MADQAEVFISLSFPILPKLKKYRETDSSIKFLEAENKIDQW